MGDTILENGVRLKADGVEEVFGFQKLIDARCGEGGVPSEIGVRVVTEQKVGFRRLLGRLALSV